MLTPARLRLNTEPYRGEIAAPDHAARVAIVRQSLCAACGDYARAQYRFIHRYFAYLAAELEAHRDGLEQALLPYGRLYAVDDWTWSALRPLPRAWIAAGEAMLPVSFAFWDGIAVTAVEGDATRVRALMAAEISVLPMEVETFPEMFRGFWRDEKLPVSPFRLPLHLRQAIPAA